MYEAVASGGACERHPTEDVRIAPQLIERIHFGVVGAEIT
jgi:hypothetical protein